MNGSDGDLFPCSCLHLCSAIVSGVVQGNFLSGVENSPGGCCAHASACKHSQAASPLEPVSVGDSFRITHVQPSKKLHAASLHIVDDGSCSSHMMCAENSFNVVIALQRNPYMHIHLS